MLFDIKRFAIHDGPGIRVTLFMKGCPLHCVWCHNPEGISPLRQPLFNSKKCIGCQSCAEACTQHAAPRAFARNGGVREASCVLCGACAEACPTLALEMAGRDWPMDELMAVVEKERAVIEESGGGVTLCGGEPLMHPDEALSILRELGRRGFHRAVDTTLFASPGTVQAMADECELFLIDLKHMDSTLHQRYTGVPNHQILENIRLVSQLAHPFWIRIPLIEGVNADEENMLASARFLASLPTAPQKVELLPYHDIGKGKHERLGSCFNPEKYVLQTPDEARIEAFRQVLRDYGVM